MANVITQEWDFLELLGKKYLVSYIYICRKITQNISFINKI